MAPPIEYASFLVRLWREASAGGYTRETEATAPVADWHSEIEHIQSGRRWSFGNMDALLGFLRQQAEDPHALQTLQNE
ncbi:MAG TPA: hypothetical protein VMY80_04400 [Anaerolineae bacterium]|nr:hypothetical protein [Anaerolineae bacterium]